MLAEVVTAVIVATSPPSVAMIEEPPPAPVVDHAYWITVAACETGGGDPGSIDWAYSGPGFYDGGLQFDPDTWVANGGTDFAPYAYMATPDEQMIVAERTQASSASDPWPNCP